MDNRVTIVRRRGITFVILLLLATATLATVEQQQAIAIYTEDMHTLLAKGNASTTSDQGLSIYKSSVYTAAGQALSQQEVRYETATLKTVYSHQLVMTPDGQYQIDLRLKGGVYTYRLQDPKGKETVKTMSFQPDRYMDITVLRRLEQAVAQLHGGKKVIINILVPSMGRSYQFGFRLDGQRTISDKVYSRIVMKAENWFVAAMAPDIAYLLDDKNNTIVGTEGPWGFGKAVQRSITLYHAPPP